MKLLRRDGTVIVDDNQCHDIKSCVEKHKANLRGANLGRANLGGADLRGANLGGADWSQVRLHPTGTWFTRPPHCSAGDWHAIVVAPGIVRIGCTDLTVEQWLGEEGAVLADENDVSEDDRATLRQWVQRMAERAEWEGWEPDGVQS